MSRRPVVYVECDVPEGMTLREWSRRRRPAGRRPTLLGVPVPVRRRRRGPLSRP